MNDNYEYNDDNLNILRPVDNNSCSTYDDEDIEIINRILK